MTSLRCLLPPPPSRASRRCKGAHGRRRGVPAGRTTRWRRRPRGDQRGRSRYLGQSARRRRRRLLAPDHDDPFPQPALAFRPYVPCTFVARAHWSLADATIRLVPAQMSDQEDDMSFEAEELPGASTSCSRRVPSSANMRPRADLAPRPLPDLRRPRRQLSSELASGEGSRWMRPEGGLVRAELAPCACTRPSTSTVAVGLARRPPERNIESNLRLSDELGIPRPASLKKSRGSDTRVDYRTQVGSRKPSERRGSRASRSTRFVHDRTRLTRALLGCPPVLPPDYTVRQIPHTVVPGELR